MRIKHAAVCAAIGVAAAGISRFSRDLMVDSIVEKRSATDMDIARGIAAASIAASIALVWGRRREDIGEGSPEDRTHSGSQERDVEVPARSMIRELRKPDQRTTNGKGYDSASSAQLIRLLEHPEYKVRVNAASELGKRREVDAVEALIRACSDPEMIVRLSSIESLSAIGKKCGERLIGHFSGLTGEGDLTGPHAIKALGRIYPHVNSKNRILGHLLSIWSEGNDLSGDAMEVLSNIGSTALFRELWKERKELDVLIGLAKASFREGEPIPLLELNRGLVHLVDEGRTSEKLATEVYIYFANRHMVEKEQLGIRGKCLIS